MQNLWENSQNIEYLLSLVLTFHVKPVYEHTQIKWQCYIVTDRVTTYPSRKSSDFIYSQKAEAI